MNVPKQAAFLYQGGWSPETDNILLDEIISLKKEMRWTLCEFPTWFFMTAVQEINTKAGVFFTEQDLIDRIKLLHQRYRVFKEVTGYFGAQWVMEANCIIASDEVWEYIMKKNWFAGAYYYNDEPHYSKLACLFGMADVKVEEQTEVIVISDNTEKIPSENQDCDEICVVDDEVNSPAVFPPPTVRRKLFPEEAPPTDRESTTDAGIYFIDQASDGQLRTRFENGRVLSKPPIAKLAEWGPSSRSPHASSCGSNSPIGWWPHLSK